MRLIVLSLVLASVSIVPAHAANLVAGYTFDESSGDTAKDAVRGSAGDATVLGADGSQWTDGFIGGAVSVDGVDDWLQAVNPIANGATEMTFSGWVKADTLPVWGSVVKNWGGTEAGQYHFGLQAGDGDLSNFLHNTEGGVSNIRENSALATDEWTHVAFTYGDGKHGLYKNGAKVAEADFTGALNFPLSQVTDGVGIVGIGVKTDNTGAIPDPGAPGFWDGSFDDFAFYDGALSDVEISTIYQNGLQGVSAVPEPSSVILGLLGVVGLLGFRRRS